jgi:hypothetical protein
VALRWRITEPTTGLPWTRERTCAGGEKHGTAARGGSAEAVQVERRKRDMEPDERPRDRETEMAATETGEPQRTLTKTTVKRSCSLVRAVATLVNHRHVCAVLPLTVLRDGTAVEVLAVMRHTLIVKSAATSLGLRLAAD